MMSQPAPPTSQTPASTGSKATAVAAGSSGVSRIDAAHLPRATPGEDSDLDPVLDAAAATSGAANQEQFRTQASQLARFLRDRRREVDLREAQLNARVARADNEMRTARLWMRERAHEYHEKEQQLCSRVFELESRLKAIAAAELSEETEAESQEPAAHARPPTQTAERREPRTQRLHEAEAILKRQLAHAATELRRAEQLRRNAEHDAQRQQQQFTERERELDECERQHHDQWQQRQHELARREAATQQMRDEAARLYEHTLQARLVVQQLWSELSDSGPDDDLLVALAYTQDRLDAAYQLKQLEMQEDREKLRELAGRLQERSQQLRAEKAAYEAWATAREAELAAHAAKLSARERELDRETARLQQDRANWSRERQQLEDRVRQLLTEK